MCDVYIVFLFGVFFVCKLCGYVCFDICGCFVFWGGLFACDMCEQLCEDVVFCEWCVFARVLSVMCVPLRVTVSVSVFYIIYIGWCVFVSVFVLFLI